MALSASSARCPTLVQRAKCAPFQRTCVHRVRSVTVRSSVVPTVPTPPGVSVPAKQPQVPPPAFGFVTNAERLNSRAAMIGFFGVLIVELIAGKGFLDLLGIATGNGLGFEL